MQEIKGGENITTFQPFNRGKLLLPAQNRVLGGFGDPELHDLLGSDLDAGAGCRITTHPRLPLDQHQFAQARYREAVLRVFACQSHESFQGFDGLLLGEPDAFSQGGYDL